MSKVSEAGYGAKLRNYRDLVQALSAINYVAARPEDSVAELTTLCDAATAANSAITSALQTYNDSNKTRAAMFGKDAASITKLLTNIRNHIDAVYGKNSNEAKQIATIITRFRTKPLPKDPLTGEVLESSISTSEMSYGSMTQSFADLITTLSGLSAYNPNNVLIKLPALQAKLDTLNTVNDTVANSLTTLRLARGQRNTLFPELHDRALRAKSCVASDFGTKSAEYNAIKGLRL